MNFLENRTTRAVFSLICTAIVYVIIWTITPQGYGVEANRVLVMIGGRFPDGLIHATTFMLFLFGILDISRLNYRLACERDAYSLRLLPEKENWILSSDDINELKLSVQKIEKSKKYFLTDLIKKCCTKYRLSKDSSEVLALADSQISIYNAQIESEQSFIRYVAWAIPSVGFIGTVWGISQSMEMAKEAASQEGIRKITDALGTAFDTTLVALVLSIILMFMIHSFQKKQDLFFAEMKDYIIENLLNRFYLK